ncbi:hypothetical protein DFH08DRAFT_1074973 [Mycena albidolilacea]|uniref:Uncharacterized protein n=1 Tax=Mycena albidolilacea TaxID=1033008 RepID=A0AAD7AIF0_9AGAR|nr:hypothetical protein DFH08DRAFT_1074973 [Mycena albidolilacea]
MSAVGHVFADHFPPLVQALRELEFSGITSAGIARVLATWFSDVVLPKVTACVEDLDIDLFTRALFAGVGPLIVFQAFDEENFEARDKDGHIRCIQYVNEDLTLPAHAVWEQLSIHCNLHRTVRKSG